MLEVGDKAPQFTLLDQEGNKVSLKDFKGQKVVLYFYPKDLTPGCTTQACDFRDSIKKITKKSAVVLGVSRDPITLHAKFAEKHELNFPLLADDKSEVCNLYDVIHEKNMYGKKVKGIVRSTFLIDEAGKIEKIWWKVKVPGHVDEVIESL